MAFQRSAAAGWLAHRELPAVSLFHCGVFVSGSNQVVDAIDDAGNVVVDGSGRLMAVRIVQSSLVVGGTASSPGTVTIAASNAGADR
jgi:hypothetical protein